MRFILGALMVWMSIAQAAAEDLSSLSKIIEITKMSKVQIELDLHDSSESALAQFCKTMAEKLGNCRIQIEGHEKKSLQSLATSSGEIDAKQTREFLNMIQKEFIDAVPETKWKFTTQFGTSQSVGKVRLKICRTRCD